MHQPRLAAVLRQIVVDVGIGRECAGPQRGAVYTARRAVLSAVRARTQDTGTGARRTAAGPNRGPAVRCVVYVDSRRDSTADADSQCTVHGAEMAYVTGVDGDRLTGQQKKCM